MTSEIKETGSTESDDEEWVKLDMKVRPLCSLFVVLVDPKDVYQDNYKSQLLYFI